MIDYYLAIMLIISVFLLGFIGYFRPFIGGIGFVLWLMMLLSLTLDPTVIMGQGFNSTTGVSYLITETVTELRPFSILSVIVCLSCTIAGAGNNLD